MEEKRFPLNATREVIHDFPTDGVRNTENASEGRKMAFLAYSCHGNIHYAGSAVPHDL